MVMNDITVMGRGSRTQGEPNAECTEAAMLQSAARQHLRAANALGAHDGVILPQLMAASLSMSLYLKALALGSGVMPAGRVCAQPENLLNALHILPEPVRAKLAEAFSRDHELSLEETLEKFSNAAVLICQHHQIPDSYEGFDLHEFMQLARFFGEQ